MGWQNPGPISRWCPRCGVPRVSGVQVTDARNADEMDDENTYVACSQCGTRLEAITVENNGGMQNMDEPESDIEVAMDNAKWDWLWNNRSDIERLYVQFRGCMDKCYRDVAGVYPKDEDIPFTALDDLYDEVRREAINRRGK